MRLGHLAHAYYGAPFHGTMTQEPLETWLLRLLNPRIDFRFRAWLESSALLCARLTREGSASNY